MTQLILLGLGFILVTASLCVALPLLVYGTTLAAFGLPHVVAEMRYVYHRFRIRWSKGYIFTTGCVLAAIVFTRILLWVQLISPGVAKPLELGLVASLVALTLPVLWRKGVGVTAIGVCLLVGVAWGTATVPIATALFLAVLHNFTPVGFFYEVLPKPKRARVLLVCVGVFLIVPLIIATGAPFKLLAQLEFTAPEATLINLGSLSRHIGVYVPQSWQSEAFALHLFSAVVFAQCMHYAAVIHILPRLGVSDVTANRRWSVILLCVGGLTLAAFSVDFFVSRKAYGLFAAVHAWIEVPILIAALMGPSNTDIALTNAAT